MTNLYIMQCQYRYMAWISVRRDWVVAMQAFYSGTVRVWNELYSADADVEGIISRRDSRWHHVGVSVRRPRAADLQRVFWHASHGTVSEYE